MDEESRRKTRSGGRVPAGIAGRQRGVALVIGLVILVVLAMLGVSAYSVATQDERIAGNARDHARAMDAAQAMLRACEYYIEENAPAFGSQPGFLAAPTNGVWAAMDTSNPTRWTGANVVPITTLTAINNLITSGSPPDWAAANPPQCIAEAVPTNLHPGAAPAAGQVNMAHVTVQGYGLNASTVVTLESYVAYY
jgi:type IV pilus assembly protein PilX